MGKVKFSGSAMDITVKRKFNCGSNVFDVKGSGGEEIHLIVDGSDFDWNASIELFEETNNEYYCYGTSYLGTRDEGFNKTSVSDGLVILCAKSLQRMFEQERGLGGMTRGRKIDFTKMVGAFTEYLLSEI